MAKVKTEYSRFRIASSSSCRRYCSKIAVSRAKKSASAPRQTVRCNRSEGLSRVCTERTAPKLTAQVALHLKDTHRIVGTAPPGIRGAFSDHLPVDCRRALETRTFSGHLPVDCRRALGTRTFSGHLFAFRRGQPRQEGVQADSRQRVSRRIAQVFVPGDLPVVRRA